MLRTFVMRPCMGGCGKCVCVQGGCDKCVCVQCGCGSVYVCMGGCGKCVCVQCGCGKCVCVQCGCGSVYVCMGGCGSVYVCSVGVAVCTCAVWVWQCVCVHGWVWQVCMCSVGVAVCMCAWVGVASVYGHAMVLCVGCVFCASACVYCVHTCLCACAFTACTEHASCFTCMIRKCGLLTFSWTDLNKSCTREGVALLPLIRYLLRPPITI